MLNNNLSRHILRVLQEHGPMYRSSICKKVGKPRTTVYDALAKLENEKMVHRFNEYDEDRGRGRPRVLWEINNGMQQNPPSE